MNKLINDKSFSSEHQERFLINIFNGYFIPYGFKKMFRYDIEFTPYGVDIVKNEDGFFQTMTRGVSLRMFSRFYNIDDACYMDEGTRFRVYMDRYKDYSSHTEVKKVFDNSIMIKYPKLSLGKFHVDENTLKGKTLTMTVINDKNKKFLLLVPSEPSDITNYLASSFYNFKLEYYANNHNFKVTVNKHKVDPFLREMFRKGYVCYKDDISGGLVFVENEVCEFCDDATVSGNTLYDKIELCPDCYQQRNFIKKVVSEISEENKTVNRKKSENCSEKDKREDIKAVKKTPVVKKTPLVVKIRKVKKS